MTDQYECPKCGRGVPKLMDVADSDDFDHDEVCGRCIIKQSKRHREAEEEKRKRERRVRGDGMPVGSPPPEEI